MNFSNYFNNLLNETFSFLQSDEKIEGVFYQIGEEKNIYSENISLTLDSTNNKDNPSKGIINNHLETGNGNDVIEINEPLKTSAQFVSNIFTNGGADFISLNTLPHNKTTHAIFSGLGMDQIVSTGLSHDMIYAGPGDDLIFSGQGKDLINGEDGDDTAVFEGNASDYILELTDGQEIIVRHKEDDQDENTLLNVEQLVFADVTYQFAHDQWVLLDTSDLFSYFANFYSSTYNTTYSYLQDLNEDTNWYSVSTLNTDTQLSDEVEDDDDDISITMDDWSNNEDSANALVEQLSPYEETENTSVDETPIFQFDPQMSREETQEMVADYLAQIGLPFDPEEVRQQMHEKVGSNEEMLLGQRHSELIVGGERSDYLFGGGGDDILIGNQGNDFLIGDKGNDLFVGGQGIDTVFYQAMSHDFILDMENSLMMDKKGHHGHDIFNSVERIMFLDALYEIKENRIELIKENPLGLLETGGKPPHLEIIQAKMDIMEEFFPDFPPPPPPPVIQETFEKAMLCRAELEQELRQSYQSTTDDNNQAAPMVIDI